MKQETHTFGGVVIDQWFEEYRKRFGAEIEARGEARGRAGGLLKILLARGFELDDSARDRITQCSELDTLDRWIERALSAKSLDEVFDDT